MFSSFSQYLPAALQNTIAAPSLNASDTQEFPPQSNFDPTTDDEGDEEALIAQSAREQDLRLQGESDRDDRRKIKSKKERDAPKMASETLIFVRPPPSKSNHPLNLQVQLVPPNSRAPSGIAPLNDAPTTPTSASSVSTMTTDDGGSIASEARSTSTRSTTGSNYSTNHSSTSTTSFSSATSDASGTSSATTSSSGRNPRRIIPLYNLQAHNMLTNTIVDAGTDAKIARFQKRGLELIDLAVLEPVEVWGMRNKEVKREGMMISVDEMGTIVHTNGTANRASLPSSKNMAVFLQPCRNPNSSRPTTPSAASSAVSLASKSTEPNNVPQGQSHPHLLVSPPEEHDAPASAPPDTGILPSDQPVQAAIRSSNSPVAHAPIREASSTVDIPSRTATFLTEPQGSTETSSTTPSKKSTGLFGKLKFNTKRQTNTTPSANDTVLTTSPVDVSVQQSNEFAEFAMAPLSATDLNHRHTTNLVHLTPSTPHKNLHLSPPTSPSSISSQNSNTPTPTPITPRNVQEHDSTEPASPTPTVGPQRVSSGAAPPHGGPGHARNLSLTGAFSRGKRRMSGIKGNSPSPSPMADREGSTTIGPDSVHTVPSPNPAGGARGLFGKLAAGISGNNSNTSGNGVPEVDRWSSGLLSRNAGASPRASVDSTSSAVGGLKSKFDRILNHSSSQQFIGNSGAPAHTPSLESLNPVAVPSPIRPLSQLLHQPVVPPAAPIQPSASQTQLQNVPPLTQQPHHVTLRQLQLRPPVLGLQPTYVSASIPQSTAAYHSQQPSTASLASNSGQQLPRSEDGVFNLLRQVESRSTLSGETEESFSAAGSTSNKKRSGSKAQESSARNSLNLEREPVPSTSAFSTTTTPPSGKEKALMYVWLVRRWLKKRNVTQHGQGASESRAGGLFSSLVGGRDREQDRDRDVGKRGSWHAGNGTSYPAPSLGALGSRSHQPSGSALAYASGSRLVLGPVVGGGLEVRFEWKRAKAKREKRGRKKDKGKGREREKREGGVELKARDMLLERSEDNTPRPAQTPTLAGGQMVDASPRKVRDVERRRTNRLSTASVSSVPSELLRDDSPKGSVSPSGRGTNTSSLPSKRRPSLKFKGLDDDDGTWDRGEGEDDGEESDAEDSETPWVCTLKIRRISPGGVGVDGGGLLSPPPASGGSTDNFAASFGEKEQVLRVKVGTLSQTPHHPKVVAMLKVPFPLPDVEVERMAVVPRRGVGFDQQSDQGGSYNGLMLTAEEIKDVVCSTALWLAVREGFGGVGKVNRKGDGWKIRG